jgi:hypothetical protein
MSTHKCNICNTQYKTEKTLATHMKKKHDDVKEQEKQPEVDSDTESDSCSETDSERKDNIQRLTTQDLLDNYGILMRTLHVLQVQSEVSVKLIKQVLNDVNSKNAQ